MKYQEELYKLVPERSYFAGIDSDGCVFDSMEIKQKQFFIPAALKFFDLLPIEKFVKETWEFVNLYSIHRGSNRFRALIRVFDLLAERPEVITSGCRLPEINSLKRWVNSGVNLSDSSLKTYLQANYDSGLEIVLIWSEKINLEISNRLHRFPAFPSALTAIERISEVADLMIVSQTPLEALEQEWEKHGLRKYVKIIAGQEYGTKSDHIKYAAKGKYHHKKIIMVGDAMGDLQASTENKILFFPIIPGREEESWRRFNDQGLGKFLDGTFEEGYQASLTEEFLEALPSDPPWQDHRSF